MPGKAKPASRGHTDLIRIYNEIDQYMRKALPQDRGMEHQMLIEKMSLQSAIFARYSDGLRTLARLRNLLVHNPLSQFAQPLAQPNQKAIDYYRDIRDKLLNPPKALNIAVPAQQLYTATLESRASKVMKDMKKFTYTHVPIMRGPVMIGVFSENSLLAYVADEGDVILPKDVKIAEFKNYIGLDKHPSEAFAFLPRNAELSDVYRVFNEAIKKRTRIGVLFITEHGKPHQKVLGIITAWDLATPAMTS